MTRDERIEAVARRIREQRDAEPYLYYFTELGAEAQKVIMRSIMLATLQSLLEPIDALLPEPGRLDFYDAKMQVRAMIQQAIKEME